MNTETTENSPTHISTPASPVSVPTTTQESIPPLSTSVPSSPVHNTTAPPFSVPLNHPDLIYEGRWSPKAHTKPEQSVTEQPVTLAAQWASSSVSLLFTGNSLKIKCGEDTARIDKDNGDTRTLLWTIDNEASEPVEAQAGETITIYEGVPKEAPCLVKIILVDWASVFNLSEILVESETSIHPPPTQPAAPKILLIGDSLTAGYCNPAKPNATLIRGTYDAYSLVFERALREQQREASVQVVAFPGITLAGYDSELGMKEKFWNDGPWLSSGKWDCVADAFSPEIILINLGTNDEHQNVSFTEFVNSLESFLSNLKEAYTHTLKRIGIINPFGEFTKTPSRNSYARHGFYEPDLENLINTWNSAKFFDEDDEDHINTPVYFIQTADWLKGEQVMDGVHPTVEGHKAIGERLANWVVTNGWL